MTGQWDCGAYGPGGSAFGALCFIAGIGERQCGSPQQCAVVMDLKRQQLHARIHELAAGGDPVWAFLAEAFPRPEMLLGGLEDMP